MWHLRFTKYGDWDGAFKGGRMGLGTSALSVGLAAEH